MVFHDDDLARLAGRPERIADLPFRALRDVRLPGGTTIPTLEEALEACGPDLLVNVELKANELGFGPMAALVEAVAEVIARTDSAGRVLVSSFNPWAVHLWSRRVPTVRAALLFERQSMLPLRRAWLAPWLRPIPRRSPPAAGWGSTASSRTTRLRRGRLWLPSEDRVRGRGDSQHGAVLVDRLGLDHGQPLAALADLGPRRDSPRADRFQKVHVHLSGGVEGPLGRDQRRDRLPHRGVEQRHHHAAMQDPVRVEVLGLDVVLPCRGAGRRRALHEPQRADRCSGGG
jgi:hypothetical protein